MTPPLFYVVFIRRNTYFSTAHIKEDVVELFMRKRLGSSIPRGTALEALQGWLLKSREDIKRLCTSVENFYDWLANGIPPWAAYHEFMSGGLMALYKQPVVHTAGVGETRRYLFARDLKPPAHFRMISFGPNLNQELTAPSTECKLFGTLSRPQNIEDL